jgi:hypothetical protein
MDSAITIVLAGVVRCRGIRKRRKRRVEGENTDKQNPNKDPFSRLHHDPLSSAEYS